MGLFHYFSKEERDKRTELSEHIKAKGNIRTRYARLLQDFEIIQTIDDSDNLLSVYIKPKGDDQKFLLDMENKSIHHLSLIVALMNDDEAREFRNEWNFEDIDADSDEAIDEIIVAVSNYITQLNNGKGDILYKK